MQDLKPTNKQQPLVRSIDMKVSPRTTSYNQSTRTTTKKPAKSWLKLVLSILVLIIIGLGIALVIRASNLSGSIFVGQKTSFFQKVKDLIGAGYGGSQLEGEDDNQINILLLGIGGEGHDGPYLSDTIILAQLRPKEKQVALTSIPRDYLVELPKLGQRKINAAFAEGYDKDKDFDTAGLWARQAVEKVTGLKVPYFAVVDFKGFQQAIDLVGGVDVTIENTFTDYTYPDDNYGYLPAVTFKAGNEHMNGKRALIFARSRHAAGVEGTDYARSQRQQKVIDAFKHKLISLNLISDASKINGLFSVFANHFHTNIGPGQLFRLYSISKDFKSENIISTSLDPSTNLICPQTLESNGAFVLSPCAGKTNEDIENFFKNIFTNGKLLKEKAVVWLADSIGDTKNYNNVQKKLEGAGITVYKVSFGSKTSLDQNVVYSANSKPATLEFIKNSLNATETNVAPPGIKVSSEKVDIILILGK